LSGWLAAGWLVVFGWLLTSLVGCLFVWLVGWLVDWDQLENGR